MSEPTPRRDTHYDGALIAGLRRHRETHGEVATRYVITPDELDALLAAADERDALKREACEIPEPSLRMTCRTCQDLIEVDPHERSTGRRWRHVDHSSRAAAERAMTRAGIHDAEPTPRDPAPGQAIPEPVRCAHCGNVGCKALGEDA